MKERNIDHVNYCSIDVEGAEYNVLSTIDFDNVEIDVITIENNNADKNNKCRTLLESIGYKLIEVVGVDEIYHRTL